MLTSLLRNPYVGIYLTFLTWTPSLFAATALPYSTRTLPYSGWGTTARGDIRTVGMAGATVGLADTFIATSSNPAGLAMTLNGIDTNFATNQIQDRYLQNYENAVTVNNIGIATAIYPFGFSLGYTSPFREGQTYSLAGQDTQLAVTTRNLRLGVAHLHYGDRLSLGGSINFGQAELEMIPSNQTPIAYHAYSVSGTLGATYQFPGRVLLAASYSPAVQYSADPLSNPTPQLPGFFQSVEVPEIFSLGLGWIPNRYFRSDFSVSLVGKTPEASLLSDQSSRIGENLTLQPRLGAAYLLADYLHFQATLFGGMYYEVPRSPVLANRMHWTAGLEAKPWVISLGWGMDYADGYQNYLFSAGIDIIKVMQRLELIPQNPLAPQNRIFPTPTAFSDTGLARPLVRNWKPEGTPIDPIQAGLDLPQKIQERIQDAGTAIHELLRPGEAKKTNKKLQKPRPPGAPVLPNETKKKKSKTKKPKKQTPPQADSILTPPSPPEAAY